MSPNNPINIAHLMFNYINNIIWAVVDLIRRTLHCCRGAVVCILRYTLVDGLDVGRCVMGYLLDG